jgi:hypothetical protein
VAIGRNEEDRGEVCLTSDLTTHEHPAWSTTLNRHDALIALRRLSGA